MLRWMIAALSRTWWLASGSLAAAMAAEPGRALARESVSAAKSRAATRSLVPRAAKYAQGTSAPSGITQG